MSDLFDPAGPFDPEAWVNSALVDGWAPIVIRLRDGRRAVYVTDPGAGIGPAGFGPLAPLAAGRGRTRAVLDLIDRGL